MESIRDYIFAYIKLIIVIILTMATFKMARNLSLRYHAANIAGNETDKLFMEQEERVVYLDNMSRATTVQFVD